MSRNLEVLEQLQQDQELFRVSGVSHRRVSYVKPLSVPDSTLRTDGCLLGLVQRLYLTANGPRRVVFCGIDEAEATNVLCTRLGRILASQVPSQVCIADANVRASDLHRLLGVDQSDDKSSPKATIQTQLLHHISGNLWLISGHLTARQSGAAVSLDQIRSKIKELPSQFTSVIINAPPAGKLIDAALLGQMADGVVLVLEANSTRRESARKAKQALESANVKVLGTVLNHRTFPIPEKIYRLL